jgi:hypothetical protein
MTVTYTHHYAAPTRGLRTVGAYTARTVRTSPVLSRRELRRAVIEILG